MSAITLERPKNCLYMRTPSESDIAVVETWMADPRINRWFDFGGGRQALPRTALKAMAHSSMHLIRVFAEERNAAPVGVVAVQDAANPLGIGTLWIVRGSYDSGGHDIAYAACVEALRIAFLNYGTNSIVAWIVSANRPSLALCRKVGLKPAGRLRGTHLIGNRNYDRLLFDILADEFHALHPHPLAAVVDADGAPGGRDYQGSQS